MKQPNWSVEAGRGLCFQDKRVFTLDRVVEPITGKSPTCPTQADKLVHTIASLLNKAKVTL